MPFTTISGISDSTGWMSSIFGLEESWGRSEGSIEEPLTVLAELKRQGLIRHLGLSNVSPEQLAEAQAITEIVCVQNLYNVAHRNDDGFIDDLAKQGIAYVPFFPLGGFTSVAVVSARRSSGVTRRPRPCRSHWRGFFSVRPTSC